MTRLGLCDGVVFQRDERTCRVVQIKVLLSKRALPQHLLCEGALHIPQHEPTHERRQKVADDTRMAATLCPDPDPKFAAHGLKLLAP